MHYKLAYLATAAGVALTLAGCSATQHRGEVLDDSADRVTVGTCLLYTSDAADD